MASTRALPVDHDVPGRAGIVHRDDRRLDVELRRGVHDAAFEVVEERRARLVFGARFREVLDERPRVPGEDGGRGLPRRHERVERGAPEPRGPGSQRRHRRARAVPDGHGTQAGVVAEGGHHVRDVARCFIRVERREVVPRIAKSLRARLERGEVRVDGGRASQPVADLGQPGRMSSSQRRTGVE